MTTIVKRSVYTAIQSSGSNMPAMPVAVWGCPTTHTPIATLRLAVAWQHGAKPYRDRKLRARVMTVIFPLAAVGVVLAAAFGTFVATMYFSGLLLQRIQQVQRCNEPHAQYSDVWKRQERE